MDRDRDAAIQRQEILRRLAHNLGDTLAPDTEGPQAEWASFVQEKVLWLFRILKDIDTSGGAPGSARSAWSTSFDSKNSSTGTAKSDHHEAGPAKTPKITKNSINSTTTSVTWAQVATSGAASSRAASSARTNVTRTGTTAPAAGWRTVSGTRANQEDERLFVRLPDGHPWRKASPEGFRIELCRQLKAPLSLIRSAKQVDTGFAIVPADKKARAQLLSMGPALGEHGAKLDESTTWHTYVVPRVPRTVSGLDGNIDTEALMPDEILRATKAAPVAANKSKHARTEDSHDDWVISFLKPTPDNFRLFGSLPARKIAKLPKANQCYRCQDFHDPRSCDRTIRCINCGGEHSPGPCSKPPRCANCHGPHRADLAVCQARPRMENGSLRKPTNRQLKAIRKMGEALYEAAHPRDRSTGNAHPGTDTPPVDPTCQA
ncbi:hypothetical protein QBC36DRAFT_201045 [Triangularia setosa]|uniref:Gag-like protein n=1 Tax=Triangularia setosa TaxID=2587417 RepID=A0AAN7A230_9PEZI|nr:hypothetical protein QBC36DRAFT_201045 [Podospora setosa]